MPTIYIQNLHLQYHPLTHHQQSHDQRNASNVLSDYSLSHKLDTKANTICQLPLQYFSLKTNQTSKPVHSTSYIIYPTWGLHVSQPCVVTPQGELKSAVSKLIN